MYEALINFNLYLPSFVIKNLHAFKIEYKAASELVKKGVSTNSAIEL